MLKFAQNIKYLRNKRSVSQQTLADEMELTRGQLASYEDNRAEPSQETLIKYSKQFKLPIDALIRNDLTRSKEDGFIEIGNHRVLFPVLINEDNENVIEVVPIKASAGYLEGYADPEYISNLSQMRLPFLPVGKHRAFPIKGDSMEPWVREGAFIVAKYLEDVQDVTNGQTYIVVTRNDGLSYKRIYTERIKDGLIKLQSDNKQYNPYDVHLQDVLELWEFTCKIDLQDYDQEDLNLESIMQMMRGMQIQMQEIQAKVN
ncbi:MAG: transcriptional regulator with XRE-family HTH domain [Patiriisocius sp.]|jgi:transcriptional regulator with XRE-family HTH domain